MSRILFVDDEPQILKMCQRVVQKCQGWEIDTAQDGGEALTKLQQTHFDVVVLDLVMPHLTGIDVLRAIRDLHISTSVIVLTGYGSLQVATDALCLGAVDFLKKPFHYDELESRIQLQLDQPQSGQSVVAIRLDQLLKKHSIDPDFELKNLAALANLAPGYVSDLLRKHLGMAFHSRLIWHRVRHAKIFLEAFEEPLKVVAAQCGFKNQQRLTEAFGRLEGISPKKFQNLFCDRRKNL